MSDALGIGTGVAGAAEAGAAAYSANLQAKESARNREQAGRGIAFDPTNPLLKPLIGQQQGFLQDVYGGKNVFAPQTSSLQQQATNQMGQFLNQPAPETRALDQAGASLNELLRARGPTRANTGGFDQALQQPQGGYQAPNLVGMQGEVGLQQFAPQANPFAQQMRFTNAFGELQNPFAGMGVANPGQSVVNAAQPVFDRNLQAANTQLSNAAPGRFSSAFVNQGIDLNARALDDFNLFAAQQLMQGEQLRSQQQQAAMNFMLGARGLQQDATNATNQANLGARGLAQDAFAGQQRLGLDASTQFQQMMLGQRGQSLDAQNAYRQAQLARSGQQLQADGQNQQFALDSRGLAQNAYMQGQQNLLQGQQIAQQGQLGAAQTLGGLAQNAGSAMLDRTATAAQLGMAQTQQNVNPLLQLMLGGLNYAAPSDMNVVMGATQINGLDGGSGGGAGAPSIADQYANDGLLSGFIAHGQRYNSLMEARAASNAIMEQQYGPAYRYLPDGTPVYNPDMRQPGAGAQPQGSNGGGGGGTPNYATSTGMTSPRMQQALNSITDPQERAQMQSLIQAGYGGAATNLMERGIGDPRAALNAAGQIAAFQRGDLDTSRLPKLNGKHVVSQSEQDGKIYVVLEDGTVQVRNEFVRRGLGR